MRLRPGRMASGMSIFFVNRFFYPDLQGTAGILTDLAQDAAKAGHQVTVLTSDASVDNPGARYAARDNWEGIEIRRVRAGRFNRQTVLGWFLNAVLFYPAILWAIFRTPRHDVTVFLSDPPMIYSLGPLVRWWKTRSAFSIWLGLLWRRIALARIWPKALSLQFHRAVGPAPGVDETATRFVYWSQDLYPDVAIGAGVMRKGSLIARFFGAISRWFLRRCDLVIAIGEHMRARILDRGVKPERIAVVHNWTDSTRVHPVLPSENPFIKEHNLEGKFIVAYSGNMGLSHEFGTILDAAKSLQKDHDILFLLIGSGKQAARVRESAGPLANIRFLPFQPRERLSESLSAASLHIVTLKEGMEGTLVPSKFYSALAVARPVIYVGPPKAEPADIIEAAGCGISIWPGDTKGFVDAVRRYRDDKTLADTHGWNGHQYFLSHFDRPISTAAILKALEAVASVRPA
jgi:colanic acid biosynthesis glycosyl transferase WcaI